MNIMKEAHKMTKEIKREFPEVNYMAQLGICIAYLSQERKEVVKMKQLKGTEKQIAWAEDIRRKELEMLNKWNTVETNKYELGTCWNAKDEVLESEIKELFDTEEKFVKAKEGLKEAIIALENEDDAKFIIENREDLWLSIKRKNNIKGAFRKFSNLFNSDVVRINL